MSQEKEVKEISCRKCGKIISREVAFHHNDEICQTCYLERNTRAKTYMCPHCKEEQTKIIRWVNASIAQRYDVESGQFEDDYDADTVYGDGESYNCPNCQKELPYDFVHQINDILNIAI